ncbi:hypothetical protein C0J52_28083 [Blattella germanica]|nr:hypothetical protein C0J52_28083 [Blattella germanica]
MRENRVPKDCPISFSAAIKKKKRGEIEYCTNDDGILITRWVDNAVVTVASTCHGAEPVNKYWQKTIFPSLILISCTDRAKVMHVTLSVYTKRNFQIDVQSIDRGHRTFKPAWEDSERVEHHNWKRRFFILLKNTLVSALGN